MQFDGFDCDDGNREKCWKHGISTLEIEQLFQRDILVAPDPLHAIEEERFKAIGTTSSGRKAFVIFTWRSRDGECLIRPVSARCMHQKEIAAYKKATPDIEK